MVISCGLPGWISGTRIVESVFESDESSETALSFGVGDSFDVVFRLTLSKLKCVELDESGSHEIVASRRGACLVVFVEVSAARVRS
jgi:hypothetical protein